MVMGDSMATSIMDFVQRYRDYEGRREATHDLIKVSRVPVLGGALIELSHFLVPLSFDPIVHHAR